MLGADVPQDIDIQAIMASIKQYYIPHALTEAQRINQLHGVDNFIATYSYATPALASLAKVITGEIEPQGKLPVDIYSSAGSGEVLYPFGHGLGW